MNFYPHFIGDYDRDTKGLSLIEHGAYRRLMDHCYATEQMLPNEPKDLYRIVGAMTPAERKAVDKVADLFFLPNGDGRRHHKRIEEELTKAQEKSKKARASAERRWGADEMRSHSGGDAHQNQNHGNSNTSDASHRTAAATPQPPDCPHEKLIEMYHALLPTCTRVVEWTEQRKAILRGRWREQSQPNGKRPGYTTLEQGLAFWHRYFTYVADSKFLTGKAEPGPGRKPFVADLEWLVRPKNFAKVVEGNYHR